MRNAVVLLLSSLMLAACVAHEKVGDSAAAVGDWKTAYSSYRQALTEKPETPGLKEKHDRARAEAIAESWQRARGCEATGDWGCARGEAEFVLQLDPVHAEAISLRQRSVTQLALANVNQARAAAAQNKYDEALSLLAKSRESNDPTVLQQTSVAQAEIVAGASVEADRLRKAGQYNDSIKLYELLTGVDGKYRMSVQAVTDEREQHLVALYEVEARRGDSALRANDFRAAHASYTEAEKIRPNGRAAPLLRYTATLISADDAIGRTEWAAAESALREAIATGKDDGRAADMLERVRFKTYKISLRSVLLAPTRQDGSAWIGNTTPLFFRISQQMTNAIQKNDFERAAQAAQDLPYENRPNLKVEISFPDGMKLETAPRQGAFALFDGDFTVSGNAFDNRRLSFRVLQEKGNEEIARLEVSLRDILTKKDLISGNQSLAGLRLISEAAEGRPAGAYAGLTLLSPATAPTATPTTATATNSPAGGPAPTPQPVTAPAAGTTPGATAPVSGTSTSTTAPAGGTAPATTPAPTPAPRPTKGKKM